MNLQATVFLATALVLAVAVYVRMSPEPVPTARQFKLIQKYKRPSVFYTQGWFLDPSNTNQVVESSGLYGESYVNILERDTYKELFSHRIESKYFG